MRLSNYVMLMFAITVIFYFLGYPPLLLRLFDSQGQFIDIGTLLKRLFDSIATLSALATLGISLAAAVLLTYFSGFGAIYILPLFLLVGFFNFFVFPVSFLLDPANVAMPLEVNIILQVFFNVITILTIIDFIRGGS
jgi:hypothetical protein